MQAIVTASDASCIEGCSSIICMSYSLVQVGKEVHERRQSYRGSAAQPDDRHLPQASGALLHRVGEVGSANGDSCQSRDDPGSVGRG